MEVVALLRILWRLRMAIAIGGIVAIALGLLFIRAAGDRFGVATVRVVLDTDPSQTVDVDPTGSSTLEWRATMAGELMATPAARRRIAGRMGIPFADVAVGSPDLSVPLIETPLPQAAAASSRVAEPYQLGIQAVNPLPIIRIDARAPTRTGAARLAAVAAAVLKSRFPRRVATGNEKYVVYDVGPVRALEILDRPRRLVAAVVAFVVFTLWCAALVVVTALRRRVGAWPGGQIELPA